MEACTLTNKSVVSLTIIVIILSSITEYYAWTKEDDGVPKTANAQSYQNYRRGYQVTPCSRTNAIKKDQQPNNSCDNTLHYEQTNMHEIMFLNEMTSEYIDKCDVLIKNIDNLSTAVIVEETPLYSLPLHLSRKTIYTQTVPYNVNQPKLPAGDDHYHQRVILTESIIGAIILIVMAFYLIHKLILWLKSQSENSYERIEHVEPSAANDDPSLSVDSNPSQNIFENDIKSLFTPIKDMMATIDMQQKKIINIFNKNNQQQIKIREELNALREDVRKIISKEKDQLDEYKDSNQKSEYVSTGQETARSQKNPDLDDNGKLIHNYDIKYRYNIMSKDQLGGFKDKKWLLQSNPNGNYVIVPDKNGGTFSCYPIDANLIKSGDYAVYTRNRNEKWRIDKVAIFTKDQNTVILKEQGHIVGPTKKY
ncbi:MAG: hypothetical protein HQK95_02290 [Nitrospirae bacterium]|nr:hypothetical protein [Nitrospirota bacterium]